MSSISSVLQMIEEVYPDLSPALRKAARYLQKHPTEAALSPLRKVAEGANVSPTTLVRLATHLGFASYNAFKDAFRDPIRTGADRYALNASRLVNEQTSTGHREFHGTITRAISGSLDDLFRSVTAEDISRASETLRQANKIYIIGLRSMFSPAFYFYYLMRTFSPNVVLLENRMDMLIEEIGGIGSGDVLLAISYEPYADTTVRVVEFARDAGAEVIALTDSKLGPLASHASQFFVLPTSSRSFYQSLVPTMALLETLISFVQTQSGEDAVERISKEFARREDFDVYWRDNS